MGIFTHHSLTKLKQKLLLIEHIRRQRQVGIALNDQQQLDLLASIAPLMRDCNFPDDKDPAYRYYFKNDQFSFGDAIVYQALLRHLKPSRVVEVGSGYSSAVALDAREAYTLGINLTFIEPYPERLYSLLRPADRASTSIFAEKVQSICLKAFDVLSDGDILFIDSSHVAKTGSDLCYLLFEIVARLKPGVIVHFHDCFWPFEYPRPWVLNDLRNWNELYFIRAFLMFNRRFEVIFFNDYLAKRYPDVCHEACPKFMNNPGGGLWLRVTAET
ncbi:MAG: class I SAM-dependent methyltransferase [Hyphomonadaceae bacterium]|nr:class I SAM-dependent methyltransferase [Hyphomonadaceae bacterium]